jgi:putative GTP pyrophosphokinase
MTADFDTEYEVSAAIMRPLGVKLEGLIEDLLRAEKIRYHSVKARVKDKESCERKLQRSDTERSFSSLTDVLGVRIITYFRDDVDAAAKVIEREFFIDTPNSVDKSAILDPDRFGYLSIHYISQLADTRANLPENRAYKGKNFEIQIRSITQHAWAEIEHDLGYKSEAAVPKTIRRRFSRLAGLLELADDEFIAIRGELADHQASSAAVIAQGQLSAEIDQNSLHSFLESDTRVYSLDVFIAEAIQHLYLNQVQREYVGRLVPQLLSVDFRTIDELSKYLDSESNLLRKFSTEWIATSRRVTAKERTESMPPVPRGVAIYYVYLLKRAQLMLSDKLSTDHKLSTDLSQREKAVATRTVRVLQGILEKRGQDS